MQLPELSYTSTFVPAVSADTALDLESLGIKIGSDMSQGVHCSFPVATRKYASSKKKSTSSKFDSVRLTDYCLRRLPEIRRINEMSRTPSAFSCLMSFIGFLSTLVYGKDGLKEVESYSPIGSALRTIPLTVNKSCIFTLNPLLDHIHSS